MDKRWTLLMDWWIRWGVSYCGRVKRIFRFFTKFVFFLYFHSTSFSYFLNGELALWCVRFVGDRVRVFVCIYASKSSAKQCLYKFICGYLLCLRHFFVYICFFFFCFIFELFDLMCLINEVSCSQLKLSKFVWMLSNSLDVINFVKYLIAHTTANILRHNSAGNCI